MPPATCDPVARFWERVDKTGDCWLWTGFQMSTGYGQLTVRNKQILAHRFAWEAVHGLISPGLFVCHKCDVRLCVRPEHLFLGTHTDNQHDMWAKGRGSRVRAKGAQRPNARFMDADIVRIRTLYAAGVTQMELSRLYAVSVSAIHLIVHRKAWKHVP